MILTILSHQWKGFWRRRGAGKSLAVQIFTGFLIAYLSVSALFLGFALGHLLAKIAPGQDSISVFCGLILYYFAFDIIMRFMMQELPVLSVQPYLGQNIRRRQLSRFLNIRSIFHFMNLLPVFLFIPFITTTIAHTYGAEVTTCFIISIFSITLFNNFLILYIKRRIIINSWWMIIFLGAIGLFIALDYFHVFSLKQLSSSLFTHLLTTPWICLFLVLAACLSFLNNSIFLRSNLYFEEMARKSRQRQSTEYTWIQQWGPEGELIALNLRLMLRNKRPRAVIVLSCFILLYGFIFYKPEYLQHNFFMVIMGALFVTGIFIINYGQFVFSWHSSYFDGIMSSRINISAFIRAQLILFIAISSLSFLLASLYGFITWKVLPVQLAAFLYNIGINSILSLYLGTRNYKGIALTKSATFNYQGTGITQWIYAFAVILLPLLIYGILARFFNMWVGVAVLGIIGLFSLLLQNWWIQFLTAQFKQRKYYILEGFRGNNS
jgi:hypothetical protein